MLSEALLRDAHAVTTTTATLGAAASGSGSGSGHTHSHAVGVSYVDSKASGRHGGGGLAGGGSTGMAGNPVAGSFWAAGAARAVSLVDAGGWSWVRNVQAGGTVAVTLQVRAPARVAAAAAARPPRPYDPLTPNIVRR